MSTHTQVEVEILASSECLEGCEHTGECPSLLMVVCRECNTAAQGTDDVSEWEGIVAPCPIYGTGTPREQADALISALTAPAEIVSPDCRDGKCAACVGDAWDDVKDQGTDCQCACHDGSAAA